MTYRWNLSAKTAMVLAMNCFERGTSSEYMMYSLTKSSPMEMEL